MTEEHKRINLAGFCMMRDKALQNIESWQKLTKTAFNLADQSATPLPYIDASVDIQEIINSLQAIANKFQVGIDYINATPAEQLTIELVQAKMDEPTI